MNEIIYVIISVLFLLYNTARWLLKRVHHISRIRMLDNDLLLRSGFTAVTHPVWNQTGYTYDIMNSGYLLLIGWRRFFPGMYIVHTERSDRLALMKYDFLPRSAKQMLYQNYKHARRAGISDDAQFIQDPLPFISKTYTRYVRNRDYFQNGKIRYYQKERKQKWEK